MHVLLKCIIYKNHHTQQQVKQNTTEQHSYYTNKPLMQTIITRKKKLREIYAKQLFKKIHDRNDLSSHAIFTFIDGIQSW